MEQNLDISKYIDGVRRRLWIVALVFIPGALLATGIAYVLPPVYESTARILVESPKIPSSLAQSTVTVSASERLQLIQQRILARENVLDVIERLNLFADRPELSPTDKVDLVRAGTAIDIIAFSGQQRSRNAPISVSSFTITYRASSRQITARVANELVTRVLELNLQSRSQQAQQTVDFFTQDVERLASDLIALESEIANYKKQNEQALPTTLQSRQGTLAAIQQQLFSNKQQRAQLNTQLEATQRTLETLKSLPTPSQNLTQEERQLAALKAQLAQDESLYTPQHPSIRQLRGQIAAMERVVGATPGAGQSGSSAQTMQINNLESQIASIEQQLAQLDEQEARDLERKAELEASIADTPRVEAALNAFQRRHDDLRVRYQTAVAKQAQAATGEKLELDQKAERFEVIEQARTPLAPVAPKRTLIAAGGAFVALGAGFALALLLEILSSAIRTGADLERTVKLRPIVVVPYIDTPAEKQKRRFLQVATVLVFIVVLPGSIWMVDQYVKPIEQVSDDIMEKSGLEKMWRTIRPRLM